MTIFSRWRVRGYDKNGILILETVHRSDAGKDAEVAALNSRMQRGEVGRIQVIDHLQKHELPPSLSADEEKFPTISGITEQHAPWLWSWCYQYAPSEMKITPVRATDIGRNDAKWLDRVLKKHR